MFVERVDFPFKQNTSYALLRVILLITDDRVSSG